MISELSINYHLPLKEIFIVNWSINPANTRLASIAQLESLKIPNNHRVVSYRDSGTIKNMFREALFTKNYLSKIFPCNVKKNATESRCHYLFLY